VVEATLTPCGPYSLRLTTGRAHWTCALPAGGRAEATQNPGGQVLVRASSEQALDEARFVLAVCRRRGLRPRRRPPVAHAALRAVCGQLVQAGKALALERAVIRACGEDPPSREALLRLSPAALTGCGLAASRAAALRRLCRTVDLERLREETETALARLGRVSGIGPWSVGVIALQGLGRYDAGLVGDLGLVKLQAALEGRWPDAAETATLLEPYGEWQGLASVFLLRGFERGWVPGASKDRARLVRASARAV
jgi:DNA-3-methyladenine glycosylase II